MPSQYQTLTFTVGQSVYLPTNATIFTISTTGDAVVASECIDTSAAEEVECWGIYWASGNPGSHDVMDADHTIVKSLTVLDTEYEINNSSDSYQAIFDKFAAIQAGIIEWVSVEHYTSTGQAERYGILLKTSPSIAATIKMTLNVDDGFFRGAIDTYPVNEPECNIHE